MTDIVFDSPDYPGPIRGMPTPRKGKLIELTAIEGGYGPDRDTFRVWVNPDDICTITSDGDGCYITLSYPSFNTGYELKHSPEELLELIHAPI